MAILPTKSARPVAIYYLFLLRTMKKILLSTILFLVLSLTPLFPLRLPQTRATAAGAGYACVLYEDTYFCAAPDEGEGLFILPVTYYVKILNYGKDYCQVEYLYDGERVQRLVGYARTSLLTFVDYTPTLPYYYYTFQLRYLVDGETEGKSDPDFLDEITLTCAYYGDYKVGSKTYCYVLRGSSFGYVPKPAGLTVPENTEYADRLTQPPDGETESSTKTETPSSPAQIAILVALCLLVPLLAALILKSPRKPPYDVEE